LKILEARQILVKLPAIRFHENNFIHYPVFFVQKNSGIFLGILQDAKASKQEKAMSNYGETGKRRREGMKGMETKKIYNAN
jgi:hypothetical protein